MITGLLILSVVMYGCFILWLALNIKVQRPASYKSAAISIIIPARNEEAHIDACLNSIVRQDYDLAKVEVIVMDDSSVDSTAEIAGMFKDRLNLRVIKSTSVGKKQGLKQGIESASSDIILTTDADCVAGDLWLGTMTAMFLGNDLHMLCGPIEFSGRSWLQQLQKAESAAIVGMSAVMLNKGMPATCNGANLMFRKDVFNRLGGYDTHAHIMSGDDDLLMQRFAKDNPGKVSYMLNKDAIVTTRAAQDMNELLAQRKRWLSKRHAYLYPYNKRVQALVVIHLLAFYFVGGIWLSVYFWPTFSLLAFKYMADLIYGIRLKAVFSFRLADVLLMPFYQLYIFLLPFYGKSLEWKGRKING